MLGSTALRLPSFDELYHEIEALPQGLTGEILGPGDLRVMPRPGGPHSFASQRMTLGLGGHNLIAGGSGWWIEVEREIHLDHDLLYVPDLAGWRVSEPPTFVDENPITVIPDWVCEILSRSTQRADRALKLPHYASAGVGHVWIVDPAARSLEVYETAGGRPVLVGAVAGAKTEVLPPFADPFDVGALWKPTAAP